MQTPPTSLEPRSRCEYPSPAEYVLLLMVSAAAYLPFVGIPYYADDYYYLFENPRAAIFEYFVSYHDVGGIFRPFQMAWCAVNQWLFGEGTWLLEAVQVAMHGLLACAVYRFMLSERIERRASFVAALLLVLNPACVSGVLGNDTISQVGSTLFGFLAFSMAWRFGRTMFDATRGGMGMTVGCAAALGLALLFKETGLSFAVIVPLTMLYWMYRCRAERRTAGLLPLAMLLAGLVIVTVAYLFYRGRMAPTRVNFGDASGYQFRLGANILINQVYLFGAALLPASTADLFVAWRRMSIPALAAIGAMSLAWLGLLVSGWRRGGAWRGILGAMLLASLATMPVTLMNHVSELYTYNMSPFIALAVASALSGVLSQNHRVKLAKFVVVILLLICVSDLTAIARKALQMRANGQAAASLVPQVVEHVRRLPPGGTLRLVERRRADACHYSIFLTSDFQGLLVAERWMKHLAGRPDVSIRVVDEMDQSAADLKLMRVNNESGPRLALWTPDR